MHATFITEKFASILERDLDEELDAHAWQDDCGAKHRSQHALNKLKTVFKQRINLKRHCS